MDGWQSLWTWIYVIGFGAFVVMAVVIIPLGFKDLMRLLKELAADEDDPVDGADPKN
jgi:hypothetical protein